jgi:hypothetical protein
MWLVLRDKALTWDILQRRISMDLMDVHFAKEMKNQFSICLYIVYINFKCDGRLDLLQG